MYRRDAYKTRTFYSFSAESRKTIIFSFEIFWYSPTQPLLMSTRPRALLLPLPHLLYLNSVLIFKDTRKHTFSLWLPRSTKLKSSPVVLYPPSRTHRPSYHLWWLRMWVAAAVVRARHVSWRRLGHFHANFILRETYVQKCSCEVLRRFYTRSK